MTPARMLILGVALVASIGLALLVHGMFSHPKPAPQTVVVASGPAMTRVLVAKVDLKVGDRLTPDDMNWQPWPAATLNAAYITDGQTIQPDKAGPGAAIAQAKNTVSDLATGGGPKLQAMVGSVVRTEIFAGEPITATKIIHSGDSSYMAVRLPAGTRAISLPLTTVGGAGGFIQPGDHVDILYSHPDQSKTGAGGMVTETILSNVLVLAIDAHTDAPKTGATMSGQTITLEVPNDDAEIVARASSQGGSNVTLALRSYADIAGHPQGEGGDHGVKIFRGGSTAETVSAQ